MFGLRPQMAQAREQDLRRAGERGALLDEALRAKEAAVVRAAITIRQAEPADRAVLMRLAKLESSEIPPSPLLVAEADGKLRAAVSLRDGTALADPFHPTAGIVALLIARAGQLRPERRRRRLWPSRPRPSTEAAR